MYQLTEYMLYHMMLHVGEMYIFHIIKVELVQPLLLPALMFLSMSICNKIQGFWNKKATLQFCPQINSANLVSTQLVM